MAIDTRNARRLLRDLELNSLFVEELNWQNPSRRTTTVTVCDARFRLVPVAESGTLMVFAVESVGEDGIPDLATRKRVHRYVTDNQAHEHILVFINGPRTTTLWSWLRREEGRAPRPNEHRFHIQQPGDSLLQRLEGLAYDWDDLDEEGQATIVQATERARAAFATNAERVTRHFYDEFKRQHDRFLDFIEGIDEVRDGEWYASVGPRPPSAPTAPGRPQPSHCDWYREWGKVTACVSSRWRSDLRSYRTCTTGGGTLRAVPEHAPGALSSVAKLTSDV